MFYDMCMAGASISVHRRPLTSQPTLYGSCFLWVCLLTPLDQVPLFPVKCCFMTFSFFSSSLLSPCTCNHHQVLVVSVMFRSFFFWMLFQSHGTPRCVNIRWKNVSSSSHEYIFSFYFFFESANICECFCSRLEKKFLETFFLQGA